MLSNNKFIKNLETVDVSDTGGAQISREQRQSNRRKKCKFTKEHYKNTSLPWGLRSTSPYERYITFDANRIPKQLVTRRCLCRGCINVATLEEDNSVISGPIPYQVKVMKNNETVKETVYAGCGCFIPKTFDINIKKPRRRRRRYRKRRNRRTC
ncbi:uncharacterized protein LOC120344838 [Styela clava]